RRHHREGAHPAGAGRDTVTPMRGAPRYTPDRQATGFRRAGPLCSVVGMKPTAAASSTTSSPHLRTDFEAAPGVYRIVPEATEIRFTTGHVFGLLPVTGSFALDHGEVRIAGSAAGSTIDAVVDAGSFASGIAVRDQKVTSDVYLDAAAHPQIVYRGLRVEL